MASSASESLAQTVRLWFCSSSFGFRFNWVSGFNFFFYYYYYFAKDAPFFVRFTVVIVIRVFWFYLVQFRVLSWYSFRIEAAGDFWMCKKRGYLSSHLWTWYGFFVKVKKNIKIVFLGVGIFFLAAFEIDYLKNSDFHCPMLNYTCPA
jgi:hypothetical protein